MLFWLDTSASDSDVKEMERPGYAKFRLTVVTLTGSEQEKIILDAHISYTCLCVSGGKPRGLS